MWRLPMGYGPNLRRSAAARRLGQREPRQPAQGSILICPGTPGELIDIGQCGLAVESHRAVRVGGTYRLTWGSGEVARSALAIVRWSRLRGTVPGEDGDVNPVFRSGFEILEGASGAASLLTPASTAPSPNRPFRLLGGSTPSNAG